MDYTTLCINCFAEKDKKNSCPSCGYEEKTAEQAETTIYLPLRTILAEKYITGKVLGQGGFGITYLGWDAKLERKLAVKEFFPQGMVSRLPGQAKVVSYSGDESGNFDYGLKRFIKEAKTLARFEDHPNIVTIRDHFEANSTAYMIMNYVEGITLEQYLRSKGGRITFDQALEIMMPVLDALREVHEEGFMHRDISPDNILINKKGE
jgi:serine/threonine protein kinase